MNDGDKAAERRKKRREIVLDTYKRTYCIPLLKAMREGNHDRVELLARRSLDFRFGVAMSDPNGKWRQRFNAAYLELEELMGVSR